MISRYRIKPAEFEVCQFTGENFDEILSWIRSFNDYLILEYFNDRNIISINNIRHSLHNADIDKIVTKGDYIMRNSSNEITVLSSFELLNNYELLKGE